MAATLGSYNPVLYANEALIHLENALGMARRVHRGFDRERQSFDKGDTINIRKPSQLTVNNAPATAEDLVTETVVITLDQWKEVKFKLTDQELAWSDERIIAEHIKPAAYKLADSIDLALSGLTADIPWFYDLADTKVVADVIQPRKVMFDNGVPLNDPAKLHYMVNGHQEAGFLGLSAFTQHQGAGDLGVNAQMRGSLGTKYGVEIFANQNVITHTKGTCDDVALLVDGTVAKGLNTLTIDAADAGVTGTLVPGDSFSIAGHTQRYAITNTVTAASNEFVGVTFVPSLEAEATDGDVVTPRLDTHTANVMFHENAFALVMAKLPDQLASELGAKVATVQHDSGLAIRSRIYYIGNSSVVHVALDVLYGIKTLDPNMGVIGAGQIV